MYKTNFIAIFLWQGIPVTFASRRVYN